MVVTFKELIFRRENWLAEVYNGFDLEVLQIGMKLNSHFAAKLENLVRYDFLKLSTTSVQYSNTARA